MTFDYQNMNSRDRDIGRCYAFARYGRKCYHCGISIIDLVESADLKEELTGISRKLPVILLDKLSNDGQHNDPTDPDLVPSCYPCNRNKNKYDLSSTFGSPSREKIDSIKFRTSFHNNLRTFLTDNDHVCYIEMIDGCEKLSNGGMQKACTQYYRTRKLSKLNPDGYYVEFAYDCGASNCNGCHISLKGMIPMSLLKQESHDLKKDYDHEYMNGDEDRFAHHIVTVGSQFITFREYYTTHSKLKKQFPNVLVDDII
jgi:hypothetical protein